MSDCQIIEYFEEAIDFINKARETNSSLFIHCQLGKSRSASIVIAYLMKYHKYSVDDAYKYLKKKRKMVMPNLGFMKQLREYEKNLNL